MKYFNKNVSLIFVPIIIILFASATYGRDSNMRYSRNDILNYFSGIVLLNQASTENAFDKLNKVKNLKKTHYNYNIKFIRTLVLLEKFDEAITFAKTILHGDEVFFEADLLVGIDYLIDEDYLNAEKHFRKLNQPSQSNPFFEDFLGNILISLSKAAQSNKKESLDVFNAIPDRYNNVKKIQKVFLQCYFDTSEVEKSFSLLIQDKNINFSRYNFFLVNYLLSKSKHKEAKRVINAAVKTNHSNLLLKHTRNFIKNNEGKNFKDFFSCKNTNDIIAEIFYVIANMYSVQKDYQLSNFYLKISLFLNNKFLSNQNLLDENYFYLKKYNLSKNKYNYLKNIGPDYSWYASLNIASILSETHGEKKATSYLKKQFKLLKKINYDHYYELANFYKDREYYDQSIKYYSLALKNIDKNHPLYTEILYRRGTNFERVGQWKKAEKDLLESLKIIDDQPYVLNYLAYTWIEKGKNLDRSLEMLKKAVSLRGDSGYIIDSLGWAYYAKKNYLNAEKYLQKAVEIMPLDPVINDHYADTLWMLEKDIQARYFWKHVLNLESTEKKLKDSINKKIIFGVE